VLFPEPGAPVMPMTCARPLCGNNAFNKASDSSVPSSIALIARAVARISPPRTRSTQVWMDDVVMARFYTFGVGHAEYGRLILQ
jgi:hypothetical protein